MATVVFYCSLLLVSTFFVWLGDNVSTKQQRWLLFSISFLLLFLPSALRYGVGADYFSYVTLYENLDLSSHKEIGFYLINLFLRKLGISYQWMFAIYALLFTFISFLSFPKKNRWVIFIIFMSFVWLYSFSSIRQTISVACSIWAFKLYMDKRIFKFTVILLIGGLFHNTSFLLIPIGYLALIPMSKYFEKYVLPILFLIILVFVFFKVNIVFGVIKETLQFIGFNKYASYFDSDTLFKPKAEGTYLGITIKVVFCMYFILISEKIINYNKSYRYVVYLVFLYALFTLLASDTIVFF